MMGTSRLSARSLAATVAFLVGGMLTAVASQGSGFLREGFPQDEEGVAERLWFVPVAAGGALLLVSGALIAWRAKGEAEWRSALVSAASGLVFGVGRATGRPQARSPACHVPVVHAAGSE